MLAEGPAEPADRCSAELSPHILICAAPAQRGGTAILSYGEDARTQRGEALAQGHTARVRQGQSLNPAICLLNAEPRTRLGWGWSGSAPWRRRQHLKWASKGE